jgi:hypothetical protein
MQASFRLIEVGDEILKCRCLGNSSNSIIFGYLYGKLDKIHQC